MVNDTYTEYLPAALGTIHVDRVLQLILELELKKLSETWQRSKLAMVLAAKAVMMANDVKGFTLNQVQGDLIITKALTLAPFETTHVKTESKVKNHRKKS